MFEEVPYYILVFSQIRKTWHQGGHATFLRRCSRHWPPCCFQRFHFPRRRHTRKRTTERTSRLLLIWLPIFSSLTCLWKTCNIGFSQPLWTSRSLQDCGGQRQDVRFSTPGARSCGYAQGHVGVVRCTVGALLSWEEGRMWLHQDQQKLVLSQRHSIFPAI